MTCMGRLRKGEMAAVGEGVISLFLTVVKNSGNAGIFIHQKLQIDDFVRRALTGFFLTA
jgi:hypothetical protein